MKAWSLTLAIVLAACSKKAPEPNDRVSEPMPYPQIITSEQPPQRNERRVAQQEPRVPPRHRGQSFGSEAGNANEQSRGRTQYKEFYEQFDEFDTDYDAEQLGNDDEAFGTVMRSALDPLAPPPPSSDDTSPSNEPTPKNGSSAMADKSKREWLITCKPHVVLRRQGSSTAPVAAKLAVGTKLQPLKRHDIDEPATGWTQVDAGEGRRGWVSDRAVHTVTEGDEGTAYLECCNVGRDAKDEASEPKAKFYERVDYLTCLNKAISEVGEGRDAGDLQAARAVALGRAAELVVRSDKMEQPYKGFMQRYGDELAWDPEGYATKAGDLWALEEKYHDTPAGQELAWQAAAHSALDRTCHHEVACNVTQARLYYGEYLKRYPSGAHAGEACDAIAELRPRSATDDSLQLDRNIQRVEQCLATIDQLSSIVKETHAVGRVQALGTLEGLRRFVLARSGHLQVTR